MAFINKFDGQKLRSLSQIEIGYHNMAKTIIENSVEYNSIADYLRKTITRDYKKVTNV